VGAIEWLDAFGWKNLETLNTSHQNLFCNSFIQGGVVGTHPNDVDVLHTLEMNNGLMKWLTFLLHVSKCKRISFIDVTIFFLCKHDYRTYKMWLWQEVGDPQPQFQNMNNPQYLKKIITIWKRREFTFNSKNKTLLMTKIYVEWEFVEIIMGMKTMKTNDGKINLSLNPNTKHKN